MKKLQVIFLKWKSDLVVFLLYPLGRHSVELGIKSQGFPTLTKALCHLSLTCFYSITLCSVPATLALKFFKQNQIMLWPGSSQTLPLGLQCFCLPLYSLLVSFFWSLLKYYFLINLSLDLSSLSCIPYEKINKLLYHTCWLYIIILFSICCYLYHYLFNSLANKLHNYFGQLHINLEQCLIHSRYSFVGMNEWDLFSIYRESEILNSPGHFIRIRMSDYEKSVEENREWLVWHKIFG